MADLSGLGNVQLRTARESVVVALRQAILGGKLAGGTRLVQADLAQHFGVSSTPVREAMRQLATEGLIRLDPYRGAEVHTPTLDEVREVYEIRLLLEPAAMRRAVERASRAELEAAKRFHEEMKATSDVAGWVLLNRRFHGALIASAHQPRLVGIIEGLEDAAAPQVALSIKADRRRMVDGNKEHREILLAAKRGDPDRAQRLVTEHLKATVEALETMAAPDSGQIGRPARVAAGKRGGRRA